MIQLEQAEREYHEINAIYEIRKIIEPQPGKLMLSELVEAVEKIKTERDALAVEVAEMRGVMVSLKKAHDWLAALNEEACRGEADEDAMGIAQCDFDESLDMLKKLTDPTWTENYLKRVAADNRDRAASRAEVKRLWEVVGKARRFIEGDIIEHAVVSGAGSVWRITRSSKGGEVKAIWNFTCRCDRLETGRYRVTVTGATRGEPITREGAYPVLLLLRILGEAMKST